MKIPPFFAVVALGGALMSPGCGRSTDIQILQIERKQLKMLDGKCTSLPPTFRSAAILPQPRLHPSFLTGSPSFLTGHPKSDPPKTSAFHHFMVPPPQVRSMVAIRRSCGGLGPGSTGHQIVTGTEMHKCSLSHCPYPRLSVLIRGSNEYSRLIERSRGGGPIVNHAAFLVTFSRATRMPSVASTRNS